MITVKLRMYHQFCLVFNQNFEVCACLYTHFSGVDQLLWLAGYWVDSCVWAWVQTDSFTKLMSPGINHPVWGCIQDFSKLHP